MPWRPRSVTITVANRITVLRCRSRKRLLAGENTHQGSSVQRKSTLGKPVLQCDECGGHETEQQGGPERDVGTFITIDHQVNEDVQSSTDAHHERGISDGSRSTGDYSKHTEQFDVSPAQIGDDRKNYRTREHKGGPLHGLAQVVRPELSNYAQRSRKSGQREAIGQSVFGEIDSGKCCGPRDQCADV